MEENWLDDDYVRYYNRAYKTSKEEFSEYLRVLNIVPSDILLDLGCGDGTFLDTIAPSIAEVWGVDISMLQIELARKRLSVHPNAHVICSGFVDCAEQLKREGGKTLFTKGFSRKALHHLTDEEKEAMLQGLSPLFASGALLYIEDGIFYTFDREDIQSNWEELMEDCARYYGTLWESKRHDLINSFCAEHPTGIGFWDKALARAGFTLQDIMPRCSFYGGLVAVKR